MIFQSFPSVRLQFENSIAVPPHCDSDDSVSIVLKSTEDSITELLKSAVDASVIESSDIESNKKYHVTRGVQ